jgi:hypothetical protein
MITDQFSELGIAGLSASQKLEITTIDHKFFGVSKFFDISNVYAKPVLP